MYPICNYINSMDCIYAHDNWSIPPIIHISYFILRIHLHDCSDLITPPTHPPPRSPNTYATADISPPPPPQSPSTPHQIQIPCTSHPHDQQTCTPNPDCKCQPRWQCSNQAPGLSVLNAITKCPDAGNSAVSRLGRDPATNVNPFCNSGGQGQGWDWDLGQALGRGCVAYTCRGPMIWTGALRDDEKVMPVQGS